jgi:hypothetical protein
LSRTYLAILWEEITMIVRRFTWLAVCVPLLTCHGALADDDQSAPAEAAPTAQVADEAKPADDARKASDAKKADESKKTEEAKPATKATDAGSAPRGRLRGGGGLGLPPGRRPAGEALRGGLGAALRAAGELQNADQPVVEGFDPAERRPPRPAVDRAYAPPGGFPADGDNPAPPDGPLPPPLPPRRPGDDGPPPPRPAGGLRGLASGLVPPAQPYGAPHDDVEMGKLNAEEVDLDIKARDLAAHYRRTTVEKRRAELREQLADVVTQHFEIRQQRRQLELERLEKQLDRLRGAIDKRTTARETLIKQRTEQLLGEEQDAGF